MPLTELGNQVYAGDVDGAVEVDHYTDAVECCGYEQVNFLVAAASGTIAVSGCSTSSGTDVLERASGSFITDGVVVGGSLACLGLPEGATVLEVTDATHLKASENATSTETAQVAMIGNGGRATAAAHEVSYDGQTWLASGQDDTQGGSGLAAALLSAGGRAYHVVPNQGRYLKVLYVRLKVTIAAATTIAGLRASAMTVPSATGGQPAAKYA